VSFECIIYELCKLGMTTKKLGNMNTYKDIESRVADILNYISYNEKIKEGLREFHYKMGDFEIHEKDSMDVKLKKVQQKRDSKRTLKIGKIEKKKTKIS